MTKIIREYYSLHDASLVLGCDVADLLHFAATEKFDLLVYFDTEQKGIPTGNTKLLDKFRYNYFGSELFRGVAMRYPNKVTGGWFFSGWWKLPAFYAKKLENQSSAFGLSLDLVSLPYLCDEETAKDKDFINSIEERIGALIDIDEKLSQHLTDFKRLFVSAEALSLLSGAQEYTGEGVTRNDALEAPAAKVQVHSTKRTRDSNHMNPALTLAIERAATKTPQGYWVALVALADAREPMHPMLGFDSGTDSIPIVGRKNNYTIKNMKASVLVKAALNRAKTS